MKRKFRIIFFIVVLILIFIGVGGIKMYKDNLDNIDNQISEGAKRKAVEYFAEEKNEEFTPIRTSFVKQMSGISVYGYLGDDREQEWSVNMTYSKSDDGYKYNVGSTGEVLADSIEEYLEQKEEE